MRNKFCLFFIALFITAAGLLAAESLVNYPSGSYNSNILLTVNNLSNDKVVYYSFKENDPEPEFEFQDSLLLSALPGEERSYNLSFKIDNEVSSYSYKIDRKKPSVPEAVFVNDGNTDSGWIFSNEHPDDYYIYYGWDEDNKDDAALWDGNPISVPGSGLFYYYAMDSAGNKSSVSVELPEKSDIGTGRVNLQVKSPVAGDFANTQLLYIEKKGFEWIKYTLNGLEPEEVGALYTGPVEIRRYGNVVLKIAAKPLNSAGIIKRIINYRVNTKAPLKNIPQSGIYSTEINIESRIDGLRYCLEDRSPTDDDPYFDGEININPVYGGIKCTVVRISNPDDNELGDFRYYYVIDDRYPANPIIKLDSKLPKENILNVTIEGPVYSDIYYTTDGSNPGKSSQYYNGQFTIDVPENKNAGSIIIKARAVSMNEKPSDSVSKIFTFDTKKPEIPEVAIEFNNETGLYDLVYELEDDENLVYFVSNEDIEGSVAIEDLYPIDQTDFFLDIPDGSFMEFNFIFAAVDSSGNMSDLSEVYTVFIDKSIPSKPEVVFDSGYIAVKSDYNVKYKYEIRRNSSLISAGSGVYSDELNLNDILEPGCTVLLDLETTDDLGNIRNSKYKFYQSEIESENDTVLFSRKSEDIYSGREVEFFAYPDGMDDELFYNLTELNDDGTSKKSGPFKTDGHIIIAGEDNIKKDYFLEVYSINEETGKKSRLNSYEFTIDNEAPDVPTVTGLKNNSIVNDRVILNAESDGDSVVFLNFANKEERIGELFSKSSIIFNKPLIFDVKPGMKKEFFLKIGAGDAAGNYSINDEVFHFIIDRELPDISELEINDFISEDGIYHLEIQGPEGLEYFYEYGLCGTKIKDPTTDSSSFKNVLELSGEHGKDNCYILKVAAYSKSGNRAVYPLNLMYRIDNLKPEAPKKPEIFLSDKNRKVIFFWQDFTDDIMFRVNIDNEVSDWKIYDKPVPIYYQNTDREIKIEYYSIDESENKSEVYENIVMLPSTGSSKLVQGIENNLFYKTNLELRAVEDKRIIRYEISTDQILPDDVSVFSPVLPEVLPFRIEEGESVNFVVSLKEFRDVNDYTGGAEQVLRFTIDKQLPEPPEIRGIADGEYYLTDCTAYFEQSGDNIFYTVDDGRGGEDVFNRYIDSFDITSPGGSYRSYKIKAYSEDFSGNKSMLKDWEITIDKEIIYVSENGRDYYEGTRSKPFQSLNKALEQVEISDRKTIFIEEGLYELNSAEVIDEPITIYGGFRSGSWQDKSGSTEILINRNYQNGKPAFYINGGNLTVENIVIKSGSELKNSVFVLDEGVLNIRNSKIFSDCSDNSSFLEQNYGKFIINNTDLNGNISNKPFITTNYGIVSINNCDFNLKSESSETILLKAESCQEYTINSTNISISGGHNIKALSFTNSDVRLKSDIIKTGNAIVSSSAIESINSKIDMDYCSVYSEKNNRIGRAFISEESELDFSSNKFILNAVAGIIGFTVTGGESNFYNNSIKTGKTNDFTYLYIFNGGKHGIETNVFELDQANEIISTRVKNSKLDFFNNTLRVDGGKNNTILFKTEGASESRIINNIFVNEGEILENTLMQNSSKTSILSFKNNCSWGWRSYLRGENNADSLITLDLVDGVYSGGSFSGNIEEEPEITFEQGELYKLSPDSNCIDSGYDLKNMLRKNSDFDGDLRPGKTSGQRDSFDIGADEFYK